MRTIKLFFFLLLLSGGEIISQTPAENQDKYWYYRHRLINNFMLIGPDQGMSIVFDRRGSGDEEGILDSDDGQIHGWYIGILATEYALLKKNNQDASETLKELYYALEAINRLDYTMELDWLPANPNYTGGGSYNGMFIRDDAPDFRTDGDQSTLDEDFVHNNYDHFNSSTVQTQLPPVVKCKTIYGGHHEDFGCCAEENSQDNAIHLMMGLALVNKFVDASAFYFDGSGFRQFSRDGEYSILNEARHICRDVINWIKEGKNASPIDIPWGVFNSVTGLLVEQGNGVVDEDGNPQCYGCMSYGMAEAACNATNTSDGTHLLTGQTCFDYHNFISVNSIAFWNNIQAPAALAASSLGHGSDHQIGILAAIGNSWFTAYPPFTPTNNTTAVSLASYFYNTVPAKSQDKEYLPLLRQVLHGGINLVPDHVYTDLMNSAPCEGPWNFCGADYGNGTIPNYEWSTTNRFRQPEHRGDIGVKCKPGEYSGTDYMLLFNLYCLAQEDYLDDAGVVYFNKMDITVTTDFPRGAIQAFSGSQFNPKQIDAFNSITADNTIHAVSGNPLLTGDVTYRAGRVIELLPGFEVEAGAEFEAYIDPFECIGGNYVRTSGDSTNPRTTYNAPTNYVYHATTGNNTQQVSSSSSAAPSVSPSVSKTPDVKLTSEFNITPNPSSGIFTLQLKESAQGEVVIYNNMGQVVLHQSTNSLNQPINLSAHPKGIYFIKVAAGEKFFTEKLVIQ